MTADQYISMGASVGTFLAAVATFLTVWQISKQRRASYRPEIVIPRGWVVTLPDKEDDGLSPLLRWKETDDNSESESSVVAWPYHLRLVNIGMGSATHVSGVWDFPMEKFVEGIRERSRRLESSLAIEYKKGAVSITKPDFTSFWFNQRNFHLDYVLPASVEKEPLKIVVPSAYILSVSAYMSLFLRGAAGPIDDKAAPNVPPLKIVLNFDDIAGEKHKTSYDVEFEWYAFTAYEFKATLVPKKT